MRCSSVHLITATVGILQLQHICFAGGYDRFPCEANTDCPRCSNCNLKIQKCVFSGTPEDDQDCPNSQCQRGVCANINSCATMNRPDGAACEGDSTKECVDGECVYIFDSDLLPGIVEDPHMRGLQGQSLTWSGEEGGWYAMLSGSDNAQLSVRITAPLPAEFPDRQLVTGLAIKYGDGNSIVIETKNPYTTEVEGCPGDWSAPCLSENALRITVGGEEQQAVPDEAVRLAGNAIMLATNLPPECQPFGGDIVWAETFAKMTSRRLSRHVESFTKWASMWIASTAAPTWCTKFIEEAGMEGVLASRSKHSVFRIQTPTLTVRLHHGTNHQGGEVLPDGRVLPKLEFWQMNVHLEWYNLDEDTVTGMLGETIRPVLDEDGLPIMAGDDAMRGEVEDYRISGPLATDFKFFHE